MDIGFKMQFETLIDEYVSSIAKTINSPTLKIAETTFPKPLLYHQKQWLPLLHPLFSTSHSTQRAGSVRAREIGKLARKHRNRYSLQQVYEIVRDIW